VENVLTSQSNNLFAVQFCKKKGFNKLHSIFTSAKEANSCLSKAGLILSIFIKKYFAETQLNPHKDLQSLLQHTLELLTDSLAI